MKTLDEVIDMAEKCAQYPDCEGCIYSVLNEPCGGTWANDAVHYLKEYRERKEMLRYWSEKAISEQQNIADAYMLYKIASGKEKDNLPLTWGELREMEGKPVWVELLNHDIWEDPSHRVDSEWWVIGEVRKDDIILATYLDEMELCEEDIDVSWKAYRKERK